MTKEKYLEHLRNMGGVTVDQPFDEDFETFIGRHTDSRKWFAAILNIHGRFGVNLKCDPMEADLLRNIYEGVTAGYHMNKTHWNTVYFDSDVPDEELIRMTENSFKLTNKKPAKKGRK